MSSIHNNLGQPIGSSLGQWTPPPHPPREPMRGRYCQLEPLDPSRHVEDLFAAYSDDAEGRLWTYLAYGPFDSCDRYRAWMTASCLGDDPMFFAILRAQDGKAVGVASYLRIAPISGSIEVGHILYAPCLKRTPAATEAMFLMMK